MVVLLVAQPAMSRKPLPREPAATPPRAEEAAAPAAVVWPESCARQVPADRFLVQLAAPPGLRVELEQRGPTATRCMPGPAVAVAQRPHRARVELVGPVGFLAEAEAVEADRAAAPRAKAAMQETLASS